MKADLVRKTFLDFFAKKGHERVHSSALVPANDPTLMFTNAGMVQFKDVFTGAEKRAIRRATTSQKCVRAGGKHNDLDEVGKTARHHTFFEMLGNFSFGDYFKEDAIAWAWELLTSELGLDKDRLIITVFQGDQEMGIGADDEARAIWAKVTGFPPERIVGLGKSENFWMMGDTGPMGPCSEIHYFMPGKPTTLPTSESPESAWDSWLEIWNLVFMQYDRKVKDGPLTPLPAPSIDTGAGLERVASVLQGVDSNYDTDLFTPILEATATIAGKKYGENEDDDISMRVIADHARTSSFLIADGVFPDKTGREYVLRRIFRRAVRHGKLLGIEEPFMHTVCGVVVERMKEAFPELAERATVIHEIAHEEEKRFRATLDRGLTLLEEEFARMASTGEKTVPGGRVFQLYDTFGFPEDLTEIIAEERNLRIDRDGFQQEMDRARERSKFKGSGSEAVGEVFKHAASEVGATDFIGYDATNGDATVLRIFADGQPVDSADAGSRIAFLCSSTPFYAESGGQTGDTGTARTATASLTIDNTQKPAGDTFVHFARVDHGTLRVGDPIDLSVDKERRADIRGNHSATHLLHLALKKYLGDHVAQKGSLVTADRLRFDFAHFGGLSEEQRLEIEDWVNVEIRKNVATQTELLPIEQARERGAVAMFGEKYGENVRVVHIGSESLEFCGGTHVERTGDIGLFKIIGESSVAQGVRRIEGVTGTGAIEYLRNLETELGRAGAKLKVAPTDVVARIDKLQGDMRALEREVANLRGKLAAGGSRDLMSEVVEIGGVKVLATSTEVADAKTLRETGDTLRDRIGSGVIVLAGIGDGQVSLLAMVTKDLTDRFHAGKLLKSAADILGGRGGGRPDMAQGGGKDPSKVPEALAKIVELVESTAQR